MAVSSIDQVFPPTLVGSGTQQTSAPKSKVIAATGGAAIGSSISVILIWALTSGLSFFHIEVPSQVLDAFTAIFTTLTTFAAGYMMPPGANETNIVTGDGRVKSAVVQNS